MAVVVWVGNVLHWVRYGTLGPQLVARFRELGCTLAGGSASLGEDLMRIIASSLCFLFVVEDVIFQFLLQLPAAPTPLYHVLSLLELWAKINSIFCKLLLAMVFHNSNNNLEQWAMGSLQESYSHLWEFSRKVIRWRMRGETRKGWKFRDESCSSNTWGRRTIEMTSRVGKWSFTKKKKVLEWGMRRRKNGYDVHNCSAGMGARCRVIPRLDCKVGWSWWGRLEPLCVFVSHSLSP